MNKNTITGIHDGAMLNGGVTPSAATTVFNRMNAYYASKRGVWERAFSAYNGGKDYIRRTLRKHPSETVAEYEERVSMAYNLNVVRLSVRTFGDYIFNKNPRRVLGEDKQATAAMLARDFDRQKQPVNLVMRKIFDYHTLCNLVWVLVDMPVGGGEVDLATKSANKIRPWCRVLSPLAVPDWCFDADGELEWVIVEEEVIEKDDPTKGDVVWKKRTLYTKEYFQVYKARQYSSLDEANTDTTIKVGPRIKNNLGRVPIIPYSKVIWESDFNHPEIDDMLTISEAILAGESELLVNIVKQTYGQLVLPLSSNSMLEKVKARLRKSCPDVNFDSEQMDSLVQQEMQLVLSRTTAIYEDGEERNIARYIQPDGVNVTSIITHNDRLMNMTSVLAGFLVGANTTQRASAESKAMDNNTFAAQLRGIATGLEELEDGIWRLFAAYDSTVKVPNIQYHKDFNINELKAVIAALVELAQVNAGPAYSQQVKRTASYVLDSIHHINDADYEAIAKDIKDGTTDDAPVMREPAKHVSEASGSAPDGITARTYYDKGKDSVSRTAEV